MSKTTELTCIRCPIGCQVTVIQNEDGTLEITGNSCPRGKEYAASEVTHPVRTVTSTVRVEGGVLPVVPVKTAGNIPKESVMDCMRAINALCVSAPVELGDVVAGNLAGLGVDLVATRSVGKQ
ncbi:MAG: DUF1667 domain-containing protein [Eubacteriales bacterium]|nr:DUF1667 domain-containing protein [Eubacteriales bacterium]